MYIVFQIRRLAWFTGGGDLLAPKTANQEFFCSIKFGHTADIGGYCRVRFVRDDQQLAWFTAVATRLNP